MNKSLLAASPLLAGQPSSILYETTCFGSYGTGASVSVANLEHPQLGNLFTLYYSSTINDDSLYLAYPYTLASGFWRIRANEAETEYTSYWRFWNKGADSTMIPASDYNGAEDFRANGLYFGYSGWTGSLPLGNIRTWLLNSIAHQGGYNGKSDIPIAFYIDFYPSNSEDNPPE